MATEYTEVVTSTYMDASVNTFTNWYTFASDGGTSILPFTPTAPARQKTPASLSTPTTIVPSSTLRLESPTTSSLSLDTTAIALSSIASYNSIQATATDPWTKDHLSSAISQYTSWARLSEGYTTTSSGKVSESTKNTGAPSGDTLEGIDGTMTALPPISIPADLSSITGTHLTDIALSAILSYESIGATATDAVLKGELISGISQLSKWATLTAGAFTNRITLSPPEQSAIELSHREGAGRQQLYTVLLGFAGAVLLVLVGGFVVACLVRMRRRRRAQFFPPLTQHVAPDLSSFGGLMAEMGREDTGVKREHRRMAGVQRVARVQRVANANANAKDQGRLLEAEVPEGIAELPG
ncbi:hypothetical protein DSL72_002888 [Monilinia vaccinii-corymbosi]|uniref:Uncharacterized protein n=1 Tax=Monilinia vaccinii-corymbosi TaxID=61207 RepID=A0A8A3PDY4_9HELO|nr:hypothetical protein DSL72_002888 [Monilinia vaccinii-corymbosi]